MTKILITQIKSPKFKISGSVFVQDVPDAPGVVVPPPSPTVTGVQLMTPTTDTTPQINVLHSGVTNGMNVKLRYASALSMTGATTINQVSNGTSPESFQLPELALQQWFVQGQVNDDGVWFPSTPFDFTLVASGGGANPITSVTIGYAQPVVNQTPVLTMDVVSAIEVNDSYRLRIGVANPPTAGDLLDQTLVASQSDKDNGFIPFTIPALTEGTRYAQVDATRGANPVVTSNVLSMTIPAAGGSALIARTMGLSNVEFTASGTVAFPAIATANSATNRKILSIIGARGDNQIRPTAVTMEGAAVTQKDGVFDSRYCLSVFLESNASATPWDIATQFQNTTSTNESAYASFATAAQLENASGTITGFVSATILAETSKQLAAITVPAGGIGYVVLIRQDTVAPTWSDGTVDVAAPIPTAVPAQHVSIVKKDNSAGATSITFQPTATFATAVNGLMAGFAIDNA
jgi:hypothetical protein